MHPAYHHAQPLRIVKLAPMGAGGEGRPARVLLSNEPTASAVPRWKCISHHAKRSIVMNGYAAIPEMLEHGRPANARLGYQPADGPVFAAGPRCGRRPAGDDLPSDGASISRRRRQS